GQHVRFGNTTPPPRWYKRGFGRLFDAPIIQQIGHSTEPPNLATLKKYQVMLCNPIDSAKRRGDPANWRRRGTQSRYAHQATRQDGCCKAILPNTAHPYGRHNVKRAVQQKYRCHFPRSKSTAPAIIQGWLPPCSRRHTRPIPPFPNPSICLLSWSPCGLTPPTIVT
ncbi:hypothetical protein BGZ61DRAFT_554171, partial [Ilyonectria robusta]|uniref:uncharacterized protein n=1 Tax=Ilyonectria robusta TaxID=1079257 RepID=UPI001E8D325F